MADKTFELNIFGFWRDKNIICIPKHPGIYFVYEVTYDRNTDSVSFRRIIYIGEAEDVNYRILKHEKYSDWLKYINFESELCYALAQVENSYRERIEAAYIYEHKPPANEEYTDKFPFNKTRIKSTGDTELLNKDFTIVKTG